MGMVTAHPFTLFLFFLFFLLFPTSSVTSIPQPTTVQDSGGLATGNEATSWSSWTPCSVTKGEGVMNRSRKKGGQLEQDVMKCFVIPCVACVPTACPTSGTDPEVQTSSEVVKIPTTVSDETYTTGTLCGNILGASIGGALSYSSFQASSIFNRNLGPHRGRLNGPLGWCSSVASVYFFAVFNEYLQVDLGSLSQICAVATQGYSDKIQRIHSYELHYSVNGRTWTTIKEDGYNKIFIRRSEEDSNTAVIQDLPSPIFGRYVRFKIKRFIGWPCLRVELYGTTEGKATPTDAEVTTSDVATTATEEKTPTEAEVTTSDVPTPTTTTEEKTPTEAEVTTSDVATTATEEKTPTEAEVTTSDVPTPTTATEEKTPTEAQVTTSDVPTPTTATEEKTPTEAEVTTSDVATTATEEKTPTEAEVTTSDVAATATEEKTPTEAEVTTSDVPTPTTATEEKTPTEAEVTTSVVPTPNTATEEKTPTEAEVTTSDVPTPTTATEEKTPTEAEVTTSDVPTPTTATEQKTPTEAEVTTSDLATPTTATEEKTPTETGATTSDVATTTTATEKKTPTETEVTTSDVPTPTTATEEKTSTETEATTIPETETGPTKGFEDRALELHNDYRKIHNAAPLRHNEDLSRAAESYAKTLFDLGVSGPLSHSSRDSRPNQGENLAKVCNQGSVSEDFLETAIKGWYDEVCQYNFNFHGYQQGLGHFSQIIWKATSGLGIGRYTGEHVEGAVTWTCSVVVARYKTAGNVNNPSYFQANVDKGNFDEEYCNKAEEVTPTAGEEIGPTEKGPTTTNVAMIIVEIPTTTTEGEIIPSERGPTTSNVATMAETEVAPKGFEERALELHNDYRKIHNAAPLRHNEDLSRAAESYAKTLFDLGARAPLPHSSEESRPDQGENLAKKCTGGSISEDYFKTAIKGWYDEVCQYNFNFHGYQQGLGHFSQIIWKATSELGIGRYTGKHVEGAVTWTCSVVVARYKTAGNVNSPSYFQANVDKGNFDEAYCNKA